LEIESEKVMVLPFLPLRLCGYRRN